MKTLLKELGKSKRTNMYDSKIKLELPKKYNQLTRDEVDLINTEYIKDKDPVYIVQDNDIKSLCLIGLHIDEEPPNWDKLQQYTENTFYNAVKKLKRAQNGKNKKVAEEEMGVASGE